MLWGRGERVGPTSLTPNPLFHQSITLFHLISSHSSVPSPLDAPLPTRLDSHFPMLYSLPSSLPSYGVPCVYVFADEREAKVGRTNNLCNRQYNYLSMICLGYIINDNNHTLERDLITYFAQRFPRSRLPRFRGKRDMEWFVASDLQAYVALTQWTLSL